MNRNAHRNAIETLEARQLMAASLKGSDVRIIAASDGTKENGNDVVLKFNTPIKTVDLSKMRMFGYSNNTILGGQTKTTINIKSATIEGNNVVLRTDVQIRKGASITVSAGGITDNGNGGVVLAGYRTTKGLNRDRFTLALRAFRPVDKSYFSSALLTGGSTATTANTAPSTASVRSALDSFLGKKVKEKSITAAQRTAMLARYDDPTVVAKVPAPNLRAGILSLVGTVGEPAIGFYLDQKNTTGKDFSKIDFDGATFSSGAKINETKYTSTGKLRQVWNPNYAGESFVVLSGLLAHETAHEGREPVSGGGVTQQVTQEEELTGVTIEQMVYAQQIVTDFSYAKQHTNLTLRANYRELLLLNSGDRQFPRVGIKNAPLVRRLTANPGFKATDYDQSPSDPTYNSFEADVRQEYKTRNISAGESPTYPTVRTILHNITGNNYTSSTKFGNDLIADIDIGQDTIGDPFAMRVARVLQVSV